MLEGIRGTLVYDNSLSPSHVELQGKIKARKCLLLDKIFHSMIDTIIKWKTWLNPLLYNDGVGVIDTLWGLI